MNEFWKNLVLVIGSIIAGVYTILNSTKYKLERKKLKLEVEKLELEIAKLKRELQKQSEHT